MRVGAVLKKSEREAPGMARRLDGEGKDLADDCRVLQVKLGCQGPRPVRGDAARLYLRARLGASRDGDQSRALGLARFDPCGQDRCNWNDPDNIEASMTAGSERATGLSRCINHGR